MLCPSCNGFRPANNAPCPLCHAPSPLVNETWNGQNASAGSSFQNQAAFAPSWNGSGIQNQTAFAPSWNESGVQSDWSGSSAGQMAFPTPAQPNFGGSGVQQMSFPTPGQQGFAQPPDGSDNSFWSQNAAARNAQGTDQKQSLLPVPFQGQPDFNGQSLSVLPSSFPTIAQGVQPVNSLVPALPDSGQDAPIYVAPMYTKPRPIIPRYRAISGLISVIIVVALLCGGAGYYAQVTGKLTFFEKLLGSYTPPQVTASQNTLPVPSSNVIYNTTNPASKIAYSVGISTSANGSLIPTMVNQFTAGQTIVLVCGVKTGKETGVVNIKWYTNDHFYRMTSSTTPIKTNTSAAVVFKMVYGLPSEGKAEVYWNDQLAATVLFVVEPVAA